MKKRLEEIQSSIEILLNEASELLEKTPDFEDAKTFWISPMRKALGAGKFSTEPYSMEAYLRSLRK